MPRTRAQLAAGDASDDDNASDPEEPPAAPARRARAPRAPARTASGAQPARSAFGELDRNARRRKRPQQPARDDKPAEPAPKRAKGTGYEVDALNRDDPQACTEYVVELYKYYREAERNWPVEMYMEFQQDINPKMRAVLVDWLVEVHLKFKMLQPTVYLTVQIIDRYLSSKQIHRKKLQLLGVAALFIACKYEEIYPPEVADFTYITDHAYSAEEVLDMEMKILLELDWKISAPNPHHWLVRLCNVAQVAKPARDRAEYYAQRMLQEYAMLEYKPSMIAAAAAHLAFIADDACREDWPRACERLTGFTASDLYPCCKAMSFHMNGNPETKRKLVACRKKFSRVDFSEIALASERCPVLRRPAALEFPGADP